MLRLSTLLISSLRISPLEFSIAAVEDLAGTYTGSSKSDLGAVLANGAMRGTRGSESWENCVTIKKPIRRTMRKLRESSDFLNRRVMITSSMGSSIKI